MALMKYIGESYLALINLIEEPNMALIEYIGASKMSPISGAYDGAED
jgi:hypothetical protein